MFKFKSRLWKVNQTKGDSKVWFSGRPVDRGVSVTQPPVDQLTQNFACEDLLGGIFDFCQSQGHTTSTEAKPVLATKYLYLASIQII